MTEFTTEVVRDVLDANLGKVVRIERQARWRPAWFATVERVERFVLADDGRHDAELVQLFNRRTQRMQMLLGPVGSAVAKHYQTQPFRPPALAPA